MAACIVLALRGAALRVSTRLFALTLAVLGCLMAHSLQPATLHAVALDWPLLLLPLLWLRSRHAAAR